MLTVEVSLFLLNCSWKTILNEELAYASIAPLCHCFHRALNGIFWHIWNRSDWLNYRQVTHGALGAGVSDALVSSVEWKRRSLRLRLLGKECLCRSGGWSQGRSRSAPGFSLKPDSLLHRYTPPVSYRPRPQSHTHNYPPIRRQRERMTLQIDRNAVAYRGVSIRAFSKHL